MATLTSDVSREDQYGALRPAVAAWLYVVALLVVAMVVVGGATRLTESGLSITEWQPILGVIPPLSEAAWLEAFAKYREIPEFRIENPDMDLAGFRFIYWWEWSHRLLGRAIGFVVLVPLIVFWVRGAIPRWLLPWLVGLIALGGLQGVIGWWMVASGLTERTDVSQYRLAVHLTLAFVILVYTVWLARGLQRPERDSVPRAVRVGATVLLAVAVVQVFLGGLVAGLNAGLIYNTWPLMDGGLIPGGLTDLRPWWRNMFESVETVQFQHRMVAYLLTAIAIVHAIQARGTPAAGRAAVIGLAVLAQAALGIATLLAVVPLELALLHQVGAAVVVWLATAHLRDMWA